MPVHYPFFHPPRQRLTRMWLQPSLNRIRYYLAHPPPVPYQILQPPRNSIKSPLFSQVNIRSRFYANLESRQSLSKSSEHKELSNLFYEAIDNFLATGLLVYSILAYHYLCMYFVFNQTDYSQDYNNTSFPT